MEPIYSELSEDDVACVPTKKEATTKVKKSAPRPKNSKEDEESQGVEASLLNVSDDDGEDDIKSKSKSKATSSQGKTQGKSCPVSIRLL